MRRERQRARSVRREANCLQRADRELRAGMEPPRPREPTSLSASARARAHSHRPNSTHTPRFSLSAFSQAAKLLAPAPLRSSGSPFCCTHSPPCASYTVRLQHMPLSSTFCDSDSKSGQSAMSSVRTAMSRHGVGCQYG